MAPIKRFLQKHLPAILLVVAVAVIFVIPEAMAQDAAPAAPAGDEAPPQQSLLDKTIAAGWWMAPIVLLSFMAITLAVFNSLQMTKKKFVPAVLKETILANMREVRVRSAIEAATQDPSYLARMITAAYPKVDATDPESLGKSGVEDAIADFSVREHPRYMVWIGYFSIIAQGAPMLGLLGTVAGMIQAFDTMAAKGASDPGALSGNISLALITTAGGLIVAIPSIFAFYLFKNRFNKLVAESQEIALEGVDLAIETVNADRQLAKVPEGMVG